MEGHNPPSAGHPYGVAYGPSTGHDLNTLSALGLLDNHPDAAMGNHEYSAAQPEVHYTQAMSGHGPPHQQPDHNQHHQAAQAQGQSNVTARTVAQRKVPQIASQTVRTLPGVLASYIRAQGKPVSEEDLCREVRKVYNELRKPDGTKYTGNLERAVRGSLCSTGLFQKLGDGHVLKEEATREYEHRLAERAARQEEEKNAKRKNRESVNSEERDGVKRKAARKATVPGSRVKKGAKREAIIDMLNTFSDNLRTQPNWQTCFQNPFKSFKGSESEDDVWKKLGNERFVFMLQMYTYLSDIVQNRHAAAEAVAREAKAAKIEARGQSTPGKSGDASAAMLKSFGSSVNDLQETIQKLNARLSAMEGNMTAENPQQAQVVQTE